MRIHPDWGKIEGLTSADRKDAMKYRRLYRQARDNAWMSFAALLIVAALYFALIFNI